MAVEVVCIVPVAANGADADVAQVEQKRAKKDTTEQRIGKLEEMLKKETARADAAEEENRQLKAKLAELEQKQSTIKKDLTVTLEEVEAIEDSTQVHVAELEQKVATAEKNLDITLEEHEACMDGALARAKEAELMARVHETVSQRVYEDLVKTREQRDLLLESVGVLTKANLSARRHRKKAAIAAATTNSGASSASTKPRGAESAAAAPPKTAAPKGESQACACGNNNNNNQAPTLTPAALKAKHTAKVVDGIAKDQRLNGFVRGARKAGREPGQRMAAVEKEVSGLFSTVTALAKKRGTATPNAEAAAAALQLDTILDKSGGIIAGMAEQAWKGYALDTVAQYTDIQASVAHELKRWKSALQA